MRDELQAASVPGIISAWRGSIRAGLCSCENLGRSGFRSAGTRLGLWAAALLTAATISAGVAVPAYADTITVEYDNLRELVQNNQDLKDANETYTTNIENYQKLLTSMEEERDYMKFMAEKYEDEEEESAYRSSASALSQSISQMNKRLAALYKRSGSLSAEKNIDSYTMTAQTLMYSYNQLVLQEAALEKTAAAAEVSYEAALLRQSAGMATAADVLQAADTMSSEKNQLTSVRQQITQARFQLLSALGLEDTADVSIGTVPEPDLAAIDAIDFESDKTKAINNSQSVQSVRHSSGSGTYTENALRNSRETAAVGTEEASITAAYQSVLTARSQYQAALDAYEAAALTYQGLQLRSQAGMLTQADYLTGEADYYEALSDKETASMNLYQAWESYQWEVKGVA